MKKILIIHSIQQSPITQSIVQAAKGVLEENLTAFEVYRTNALLEIPPLISIISEHSEYGGMVVTGAATTEREKLIFPNLYQACLDSAAVYSTPIGFGIHVGDIMPDERELMIIGANAACTCAELAGMNVNGLYSDFAHNERYKN